MDIFFGLSKEQVDLITTTALLTSCVWVTLVVFISREDKTQPKTYRDLADKLKDSPKINVPDHEFLPKEYVKFKIGNEYTELKPKLPPRDKKGKFIKVKK